MAQGRHEPRWVSRLVAEAIHFDVLRSHGGMPGLRDEGALESALARGRQRLAYEPGSDLPELAAALGYGIARDHPFNDGNKRVAFVLMAVFLGLNGLDLVAPETEVVTMMLDVAAGSISEAELASWLRRSLQPRPSQ
jgi:death on curing protein